MELTPAQTWLLAALPAGTAELLDECRHAGRLNLCVGLPRTLEELLRMLADLEKLGLCEHRSYSWHRTNPKPKKEGRLFE